MKNLLLSAYDASSHRRWRQSLERLPGVSWDVRQLPPRHFQWRVRGNALWWAFEEGVAEGAEAGSWDAVWATSTVDLAALRGLVPALAAVPTVVYFHENQLVYPSRDPRNDPHLAIRDIYTALAADQVLFNSAFNRASFVVGAEAFLKRMPDAVPAGWRERIEARSMVVPVPIEEEWFAPRTEAPTGPLQIVWNHRWEYDKAPERFFAALERLKVPFEVHVVGQRFREAPDCFDQGRLALGDKVKTWGFVTSPEAYRALLRRCDVVVSTALHEFQGLSVLEAMASGCRAVVPDRLAYRETVSSACRYPSFPRDEDAEVAALAEHLTALAEDVEGLRASRWGSEAEAYRWEEVAPQYEALLR